MKLSTADLIQRAVVTADPEMTIEELAALLDEEDVHGVPVVNKKGIPIGVVSRTDIAREVVEGLNLKSAGTRRTESISFNKRVRDLMSDRMVTVSESASVPELAALMLKEKVHRVLVTQHGRLIGIVSATDLLRVLV